MAQTEKRTLEITARLNDLFTRPITGAGRALVAFAKGGTVALGGLARSATDLRTQIVGLAGAYLGLRGIDLVRGIADDAAAMARLAASTGDTVANLSDLRAALRFGGVESSAFEASLRALVRTQAEALGGNLQTVALFEDLGITLRELSQLGPSQLFERLAQGLEVFGDQQERTLAVAKRLPGELQPLLPVLTQGIDKFQQLVRDARGVGSTITEGEAKAAQALSASFAKVQTAMESVSRAVIEAFGPDVAAALDKVAHLIADNRQAVVGLARSIGTGLVGAVDVAIRALIGLVQVIESIPGVHLVDRTQLQLELDGIREALRLIDERRRGVPLTGVQQVLADDFAKTEQQLRERQAELAGILANGLADSMRASFERLKKEFEVLRDQAAGKTPDQTATALGMPTTKDWDDYARAMDQAMRNAPIPSTGQTGQRASVFAAPQRATIAEDTAQAEREMQRFNSAIRTAVDSWLDLGNVGRSVAQSIVVGGLDGVTNALADGILGIKSFREAFRDLARQMISDIVRITIRLAIMQALLFATGLGAGAPAGATPGALGPGFERGGRANRTVVGTLPMRRFESGGIVREPTIALFGEGRASRGEAFVPLPDGRRIPVAMQGAGATSVHITIHAMDGADVARVLYEQRDVLASIWLRQASTMQGMRQTIRGAV